MKKAFDSLRLQKDWWITIKSKHQRSCMSNRAVFLVPVMLQQSHRTSKSVIPVKLQNQGVLSNDHYSVKSSGGWNNLYYIYLTLLAIFTYSQESTAVCSARWRRKAVLLTKFPFLFLCHSMYSFSRQVSFILGKNRKLVHVHYLEQPRKH